ncbi:GtrA family protein [Tsukamurella sp. 1534]|uniref:GtrA family protein n=1 Tax=Tsukamurella sp. 1534 TaxID=1151061 RepID=UPI000592547D|nr:GtrA family protein [Tsukamurella sp. 1534]
MTQAPLIRRLAAFGAVGLAGAATDFGVRQLLLEIGAAPTAARAVSYIAGSTVAYYLNSHFTFAGDRSRLEKTRAAVVYAVCFGLAVVVDLIVRKTLPDAPHVLVVSWVISQAVATGVNFVLQSVWVFRAHRE